MINKQVFELTEEGINNLKAELDDLKLVQRPANVEAIKEARAQGDLSENADYQAAREEQTRIEARVLEIENILKNVKVIVKDNTDKVTAGKHVNITYVALGKTLDIQLVGTIEADPKLGKVSTESPIGKALTGKSKGEIVTVVSETGSELKVKINSVN